MRFGICCGLADVPAAKDAGFDYVELAAASLLENLDAFKEASPEATNVFFPGSIRLYGADKTPYRDYAAQVIAAAAAIGVETMVLGSGASRKAPDDYIIEQAEANFIRIASELDDIAKSHGVTLAPESLNRSETNVGNDLGSLATNLRSVGVGYTADSYHVIAEWVFWGMVEPVTLDHWRDQIPFLPAHVHIANRPRHAPTADDEDLKGFVTRICELGYDGRISLEYKRTPDRSLEQDLSDLKAMFL